MKVILNKYWYKQWRPQRHCFFSKSGKIKSDKLYFLPNSVSDKISL